MQILLHFFVLLRTSGEADRSFFENQESEIFWLEFLDSRALVRSKSGEFTIACCKVHL